jgi:hypothetical protein
VDIVDALNTARGQYSVFSPGDVVVQERTLREAFGNDTGQFSQWMDFKMSSALAARDHGLWTGDVASVAQFWGASDASLRAVDPDYNALQFLAGVRYFNASGNGLFHFTAGCGGACGIC